MSYFSTIQLDTNNGVGDAFGRLRVSEPETIFDSKQIFNNQPLLWDDQEVSGSGTTSTHYVSSASTIISVADSTAGTRVRQTFRRFNYQTGKSDLILLTGVLKTAGESGITRSMGYYDDNNGIFLRDNGGNWEICRRSTSFGPVSTFAVPQSAWNVDTFDGTGPSGITLNETNAQIFVIDFEWLGVGRVRTGFNINGVTYLAHEFLHSNNISNVYMSTPNLPLRYEISNDGTGGAASLEHICSSVMSEGGSQDTGRVFYASTNGTHVDADVENTTYAVLGIRLKSSTIGETIKLLNTSLQIHTASDRIEWTLRFNPSVAGTFTYNDYNNTSAQVARGATANVVTGGEIIAGGHLESGANQSGAAGSKGQPLDNALILGSAIDGTLDEIVLCAMPIGGSSGVDIEGSLTWRELS